MNIPVYFELTGHSRPNLSISFASSIRVRIINIAIAASPSKAMSPFAVTRNIEFPHKKTTR